MQAIRAEHLSKRYALGIRPAANATFREMISTSLRAPFRRLRRLGGAVPEEDLLWALRDVSFCVHVGEVVGIVGRNGAGKSTLLKILSRVTEPTEGRVELAGRVSSLLEVGTGFHPELTGRDNIFLNGAILGMGREEIARKFDEIVAFSELEKFLDTPVKHYSSGMYVRLAFAVAAHLEPEILLVDEVLAVGDVQFQRKCLGRMGSVTREGRTVIFVSHNMTAVQSLCSRVLWLDGGGIVDDGESARVIGAYLQRDNEILLRRSWGDPEVAPGNAPVQLCRVEVSPDGEDPCAPMTVETPIRVTFECWNYVDGSPLNMSMVVYDQQDVCVFNSVSDCRRLPQGPFRAVCRIPGNFLNDGRYRVRALVVREQSVPLLDADNLVVFEIHDTERPGGWFGKWVGVVRPALAWTLEPA